VPLNDIAVRQVVDPPQIFHDLVVADGPAALAASRYSSANSSAVRWISCEPARTERCKILTSKSPRRYTGTNSPLTR